MTVDRCRARPGAGSVLRATICGAVAALALAGSGCGGSNGSGNGTPVITVTDTTGDFTSYIVNISSLTLTRTDGAVVQPVVTAERVDFTQLSDLIELLNAPAVAAGTYTSAALTLDYSSAFVTVNVNGQSQGVKLVDSSGSALTTVTFTIKFDPANPLVITQGKSTRLALNLDLAASNTVNLSTTPIQVVARPFVVASTTPPTDTKMIRARGPLLSGKVGNGDYIINLRPFHDQFSSLGALTVHTDAQTLFNINGQNYTGAAGLTALGALPQNTPTAAFGSLGDLSGVTPVFNAKQVYAGTSLESFSADHVTGVVNARTGDKLSVHGATVHSRGGTFAFSYASDVVVNVGDATVVTQDGQATATGLNKLSISVGQHIDASGQGSADAAGNVTLDATAGQVRLAPTPIWGTLKSATAGSLTLNLQALDNYEPSAFTFTGTGSTPTSDASPGNYVVNTGSMDQSSTAIGTPLRITGFVNAFGSAPPAFTAIAITPSASAESQLDVEWINGGTTAPFTSANNTGLVVNLANTNLSAVSAIRTGPASVGLTTLSTLTIVPASTIDELAIGNTTAGISVAASFSSFATQLGTTLNGTTAVRKLIAVGRYDAGSKTFSASRLNVVLQ